MGRFDDWIWGVYICSSRSGSQWVEKEGKMMGEGFVFACLFYGKWG